MEYLKIDMDHCSSPLWRAKDNNPDSGWINVDLSEYDEILSPYILHALSVYQDTWEALGWSNYMGPEDFPTERILEVDLINALNKMKEKIAKQIEIEHENFYVL